MKGRCGTLLAHKAIYGCKYPLVGSFPPSSLAARPLGSPISGYGLRLRVARAHG